MSTSTLTPLLTTKEVGLIIRRHPKTVLKLVARGELNCIQQDSTTLHFTEQHVLDYLASKEVRKAALAETRESEPKPARNPKYGESASRTTRSRAKK